jgi:hypothetical protein
MLFFVRHASFAMAAQLLPGISWGITNRRTPAFLCRADYFLLFFCGALICWDGISAAIIVAHFIPV